MGHRSTVITTAGIVRVTDTQWRIMRFWADNTNDRGRLYLEERGPAPTMHDVTWHLLYQRDWMRTARQRTSGGYYVTDAGRAAAGLPPVHRDRPCPVVRCDAVSGERCMDGEAGDTLPVRMDDGTIHRFLPYIDGVHFARQHPRLYERIRTEMRGAGDDEVYAKMRTELGAAVRADAVAAQAAGAVTRGRAIRALTTAAPGLGVRFASRLDPQHIGYVTAT